MLRLVCILLMFAVSSVGYAAAQVQDARSHLDRKKSTLRIVLDIDGTIKFNYDTLTAPHRLYIDLHNTKISDKLKRKINRDAQYPVNSIRFHDGKKKTRIVFDLMAKIKPIIKIYPPAAGKKSKRLVIDIKFKGSIPKHNRAIQLSDLVATNRDIIITIDAGHGGKDPGAVSTKPRLYEKNVVLDIALQLAKIINNTKGYKAYLVRSKDKYIRLFGRMQKGRDNSSDLFLSIHADAALSRRVRGVSAYIISTKGSSSAQARYLANKHNRSDLVGLEGTIDIKSYNSNDYIDDALIDLAASNSIFYAEKIANTILKELAVVSKVHKKRVERAEFLVLKAPDVPSVLLELGFISNKYDARNLSNAKYRKKLARTIFKGVQKHFRRYPIDGSYLQGK